MIRAAQLVIATPCTEPSAERGTRCPACDKFVHDLSQMTEAQARALLARHEDAEICVAYRVDARDRVEFRPEPSRVRAWTTAIAAAGALGCTPWGGQTESTHPTQLELAISDDLAGYGACLPDVEAGDGTLAMPRLIDETPADAASRGLDDVEAPIDLGVPASRTELERAARSEAQTQRDPVVRSIDVSARDSGFVIGAMVVTRIESTSEMATRPTDALVREWLARIRARRAQRTKWRAKTRESPRL